MVFDNISCNLFSEYNNAKCNIHDIGGSENFKENSLDIFCGEAGIKECNNIELAGSTKVCER